MKAQPIVVQLPDPAMRRLDPLVGTWSFVEEGDGAPGTGEATIAAGPGGHALSLNEARRVSGASSQVLGLLGWRPEIERYGLFLSDSRAAGIQLYLGEWQEETLVFYGSAGNTLARRYEFRGFSPDRFELRAIHADWAPVRRVYRRTSRPASGN